MDRSQNPANPEIGCNGVEHRIFAFPILLVDRAGSGWWIAQPAASSGYRKRCRPSSEAVI